MLSQATEIGASQDAPSQAEIGASQDAPSQGCTAREQGEASLWILKNRLPSDSFSKTG